MVDKALVVLSGGQDSTTTLFWAKQIFDEVHAITFDYNQKHRREIDSAILIAEMANVLTHKIVEIGPVLEGRSPLTNPTEKLEQYENYTQMDKVIGNRVELTFVPMRNTLFLTLAANRAVCLDIYDLITGVCQADNANYPDCTEGFITDIEQAFNQSLGFDSNPKCVRGPKWLTIRTPLIDNSKAATVRMALELPGCWEALAYSHTSYDGAYPPIGKDHATVLRAQGFLEAGYPDPLVVRAWHEGAMALPETKNYSHLKTISRTTLQAALDASRIQS